MKAIVYFSVAVDAFRALQVTLANFIGFYWNDFKSYVYFALITLWNLIKHTISYYIACYQHLLYIEQYNLEGYQGLQDMYGRYVWNFSESCPSKSNAHINQSDGIEGTEDHHPSTGSSHAIGFKGNDFGNPSHFPIAFPALNLMWRRLDTHIKSYSDCIFVDFGCGAGMSLLTAIQRPLKAVIGVEIDKNTAMQCTANINRFRDEQKEVVRCGDTRVLNMDMMEFSVPKEFKNSTVILYMYEPLWTFSKEKAHPIYRNILRNMFQKSKELFVVYFFAGKYTGDAMGVFGELQPQVLGCDNYPSLFFGATETRMTIYHKK